MLGAGSDWRQVAEPRGENGRRKVKLEFRGCWKPLYPSEAPSIRAVTLDPLLIGVQSDNLFAVRAAVVIVIVIELAVKLVVLFRLAHFPNPPISFRNSSRR